jgi:ribose 5-phosphate isomerase A
VGLGTGSTAYFTLERLATRIQEENLKIQAVSTSFNTTLLCRKWNIPLLDLGATDELDIAIDGADEIDTKLNLIKGRGAAHTLEKIVAKMAHEFVVVADNSKKVVILGTQAPVPVEVMPQALAGVRRALQSLGAISVDLRMAAMGKDGPIISDNGKFVLDDTFERIDNPLELEKNINNLPGVLDNGIFAGIARRAIVASTEGVEILTC